MTVTQGSRAATAVPAAPCSVGSASAPYERSLPDEAVTVPAAGSTVPDVRRWASVRSHRATRSLGWWGLRALSLVTAVVIWHLLTVGDVDMWLRFSKLPGPADSFREGYRELTEGQLLGHIQASARRIGIGFTLAGIVGTAIGVLVGRSRMGAALLGSLLEVARPIPAIAWVPISILLFPDGEQSIVAITFFAAFFPVAVATRHATRALPYVWEDAARTMGAGRFTILWRVVLPGALPAIFSALSVSIGVAWICVVSAEMISGQFGVGYYTWMSYSLINYPAVVAGMLTIGFLGLISAGMVELTGRWATRWLPRSEAA